MKTKTSVNILKYGSVYAISFLLINAAIIASFFYLEKEPSPGINLLIHFFVLKAIDIHFTHYKKRYTTKSEKFKFASFVTIYQLILSCLAIAFLYSIKDAEIINLINNPDPTAILFLLVIYILVFMTSYFLFKGAEDKEPEKEIAKKVDQTPQTKVNEDNLVFTASRKKVTLNFILHYLITLLAFILAGYLLQTPGLIIGSFIGLIIAGTKASSEFLEDFKATPNDEQINSLTISMSFWSIIITNAFAYFLTQLEIKTLYSYDAAFIAVIIFTHLFISIFCLNIIFGNFSKKQLKRIEKENRNLPPEI